MAHWGMVIDLRQCIGCKGCTIVCKETHRMPLYSWRKVHDCGVSERAQRQRLFLPMSCMQCEKPPCLEVCPTTATTRRPDGIVAIDHNLCVGCGYCVVACPYRARTILVENEHDMEHVDEPSPAKGEPENGSGMGVCTKCSFCLPRVQAGLALGLKPGVDPEASPACVISCSSEALHFGDLDDPESVVSRLICENRTARLQESLGTKPSVYYIVPPWWDDAPSIEDGDA